MNLIKHLLSGYSAKKKKARYIAQLQNLAGHTMLRSELHADKTCFSHIGLIGDIIYSIPCMLALAGNKRIELYLDITQPSMYPKKFNHYNEGKILTEKSVDFLRPLLLSNPAIAACEVHKDELIDYNLNDFRKYPFDYRMGHICRWYFLAFAVNYDLGVPWLRATPNSHYKDEIIIARSFRYRAPEISYRFLSTYPNLSFLGLTDEFEDMKRQLPNLKHIVVKDALHLAEAIAGCKLFIGNQSFPFAVAEALKVKRVLEVSYECPNVIVEGINGYDFCFQKQFEKIIEGLK